MPTLHVALAVSDDPASATVSRFLDSIRSGNAVQLKSCVLAPTARDQQQGFDRWASSVAQMGKKLEPQFKPVSDSKIAGDFAVVRGGFSDKPYMRLWKRDGAWKILAPGDPKVIYGMTAMDALNLSTLEKWADREWKDAPPPGLLELDTQDINVIRLRQLGDGLGLGEELSLFHP
jgi:hypothetical protein